MMNERKTTGTEKKMENEFSMTDNQIKEAADLNAYIVRKEREADESSLEAWDAFKKMAGAQY